MKKTIVVVGAGKGLGNAVAEKFGTKDFKVILMARNQNHLKEYKNIFAEKKIETYTYETDVADFENFKNNFQNILEKHGMPDVVFYNVGITVADEQCNINSQTIIDRYIVDVVGAYNLLKLIDNDEFAKKKGAMLVTGGGLAIQPYAGYLPLSMDKAALRAMIQAMAPVLKEKGIFLGTIIVTNVIGSNQHYAPATIADEFWKLYIKSEETEIIY